MKRLLFVIESLRLGGAEKSLVTLLNLIDYQKYKVDLLLFNQKGEFQVLLPKEVRVLSVPDYFLYNSIPWKKMASKVKEPKKMITQLRYSLSLRLKKQNNTEKAVDFWKQTRKCFSTLSIKYDVAIAYAQGVPTFFVAEKVNAIKKIAWINVANIPTGKNLKFIKDMYRNFNYINFVSKSAQQRLQEIFCIPNSKIMIMRDIIDVKFIHKMSEIYSNVESDMQGKGIKILTVGRLDYIKGYDLAIDAAKILKEFKVDFTWYVIGNGNIREELEEKIKCNNLENKFILLGGRSNPYPYFRRCDLYVQTSRVEGFGITLAEAKIFNKPIVTTNFSAVNEQFFNRKNGVIVDINAEKIADGILQMINNEELRNKCIENVKSEKKGNSEEIYKLYEVIEEL